MNADFRELLSACAAADVKFLVIGAYAVGVHGRMRATKDLDVWIEASPANARRLMTALRTFGAPLDNVTEKDFEAVGPGFMMGVPPSRIDILTEIDGVEFAHAWKNREEGAFGELRFPVIGLADLIANKRASARPRDLDDVQTLEKIQRSGRK